MAARPGELSLTSWLDPAFKYFADQAKIPVDQYSSQVGGEGIATGLEMLADLFTKGWLNKVVQFLAGLIADGYAIWGKDVPTRLRRELLAVGTHELLRIANPKPSEIIEVRQSLENFISAVQRGDWNAALASILRTPSEIQAMFGAVAPSAPAPPQTPPAGEGRKYEVTPERPPEPTPTKPLEEQPTKGRYRVTGG